jgi:phosphate transport system permease protein
MALNRDFTVKRVRWGERLIEEGLRLAAVLAVLIVAGIVWVLVSESASFFAEVSLLEFVSETRWTPTFADPHYGIAPLLTGPFMVTLVALSVAVPLGVVVAIFLSEFAGDRVREIVKPILELLAGVPTVVYGYFALLFVTPLLQVLIPGLPGFNILSAGVVMGLMIIPYIASLSEDALRAVPQALRDGSYALGATKLETALRVVLPAAISGVIGAIILGMARAVGETMIVAIAAGTEVRMVFSPLEQGATVTAFIAQVAKGDLAVGTLPYQSIFAAGVALLILTLIFNFFAVWLQRRLREAY